MHTNDIITEKENISTIQNLRTFANIHQDQNYQGEGWFHIPFIKSCRSKWTLSIDCTGIGKIRLAEILRVKNKLGTALEIVQEFTVVFLLVRLEPSHSKQGSIRTYIYVYGILVLLNFSILFSIIITLPNIKRTQGRVHLKKGSLM